MSTNLTIFAMVVHQMPRRYFAVDAILLKQSGFAADGSEHDGDPGGLEQLGSVAIDGDSA